MTEQGNGAAENVLRQPSPSQAVSADSLKTCKHTYVCLPKTFTITSKYDAGIMILQIVDPAGVAPTDNYAHSEAPNSFCVSC